MNITLFEHNKVAYESALSMLDSFGKAAIVHPTGTGKSFIGFKLCADHPQKTICWISPSEYIFKTQLENLKKATDGYIPENIKFFTYAKLMLQSDEANESVRPDYIILDEFHRCGAEMWGQGVKRFLGIYPDVPILGLSATAIRYLDNQRNMASELFDGHIASEMTLGEAIVRGILNPPKYVISVFSYQKDIEKYQNRIRKSKSRAVKDAAQAYLDALRRTLEKADGLDAIFERHMSDKSGKYIVFCSDLTHMREMINKSSDWFVGVDPEPNIYVAYSNDPETDKAFFDFKQDHSEHLKLLFCIDMLNEGIHVDDVDGVILLRPTVSPIVYKQQIGRALCAGSKKNSVIFDIVLNIENLYSIGAVEEEMEIATAYYRSLGLGDEIINEHFKVIDEVRDCCEIFDRLNNVLSASWELMYQEAKRYYNENGDLDIPRRYVTENGYTLGSWLNTQRQVYAGKCDGKLTDEQITLLNDIGMRWESVSDISWSRYFDAAERYFEINGDLLVPVDYVTSDGIKLGMWISNLRTMQKNGIRSSYLSSERISSLDHIGMVWEVSDYLWDRYYNSAFEYHKRFVSLDVPLDYVDESGVRLGAWINNIRTKKKQGKLTIGQIDALERLGISWDNKYDARWERMFVGVCNYKKRFGDLDIPVSYRNKAGQALGKWLRRQKDEQSKGKLLPYRKTRLAGIGITWDTQDPWEKRYDLAASYFEKHGDLNIPVSYKTDGICMNKWINEQRQIYIGNRPGKQLSSSQIARLEAIGMVWEGQKEQKNRQAWDVMYSEACLYYKKFGNLKVPGDYLTSDRKKLSVWLTKQKKRSREGTLSEDQIKKLNRIGALSTVAERYPNKDKLNNEVKSEGLFHDPQVQTECITDISQCTPKEIPGLEYTFESGM